MTGDKWGLLFDNAGDSVSLAAEIDDGINRELPKLRLRATSIELRVTTLNHHLFFFECLRGYSEGSTAAVIHFRS